MELSSGNKLTKAFLVDKNTNNLSPQLCYNNLCFHSYTERITNMNNKIYKLLHYIINFLLIILWFILMFFSEYITTINFKIFFVISLVCITTYSFYKKKYLIQQTSKTEKIFFSVLIILLFIRLIFF